MKKLTTLAAAALALAMTGAGALAETTLQLGTTVNEQDSFHVAAVKFAELVDERTNGEYKIEIYPNGTLGGESDMLDSMSTGMLDMGIITSGPFVNFSEMMGVLDMPYLFANNEEAYKVLDGEIGRELLDTLEDAGLKGLAYAERGFRNVTNSVRPVTCADDLAGLKLRVMENEVYTATFKALKVNAVPMAWAEALTAMQQGTIEGEENPINVIYSYSLWDYGQKYVTLDRHSYSTAIITMSLDVFNSLDEATQAIFLQSAQEAAEYERAWVAEQEADQLATIKSHGVEVVENPDVDSLRAAVQSVYDAYPQYADYIARIQALLAESFSRSRVSSPSRGGNVFLPFEITGKNGGTPHDTQENSFARQRRARSGVQRAHRGDARPDGRHHHRADRLPHVLHLPELVGRGDALPAHLVHLPGRNLRLSPRRQHRHHLHSGYGAQKARLRHAHRGACDLLRALRRAAVLQLQILRQAGQDGHCAAHQDEIHLPVHPHQHGRADAPRAGHGAGRG